MGPEGITRGASRERQWFEHRPNLLLMRSIFWFEFSNEPYVAPEHNLCLQPLATLKTYTLEKGSILIFSKNIDFRYKCW